MKKKLGVWKKKGTGPSFLGGYEMVKNYYQRGEYLRLFTLVRIPKRGPVSKKTLYFSSAFSAKKKGWKLV